MDKNVQYILEVAKCGGITKAANNLYITPSALSKFVQAREEELNVQLFHRIGKRFVLTAAGEYYVGRCKEIETIQKEITIQMERFSTMSHGMIRIGVQPSFSDLVLKDIIPKFQESFPAVKIILQEYSTGELMELLKKQQVDVVLATIDQKDADLQQAGGFNRLLCTVLWSGRWSDHRSGNCVRSGACAGKSTGGTAVQR